jgi:hypothetical protein
MLFKKTNGNLYGNSIDLNPTSAPITVVATDETTNSPITATWYLGSTDGGAASIAGSLNVPAAFNDNNTGLTFNVGQDPTDPAQVQAASVPVVGTSVQFFPAPPGNNNLTAKSKLVATYGGQTRSLLISIAN